MVRGHAVLLTLLLAPVLAGCSDDPGIVSDGDDLAAAIAVWSDPWVAPTSATVAGPALGSNGQVDRVVARRTTTYAAEVEAAVRTELREAEQAGWAATSSTCGDSVEVALVGPDGAVAQLVVTPDGDVADATVQVATPHHLDGGWTTPTPAGATCLDGEAPTFDAPPLQSAPIGDDATEDRTAEWASTSATTGVEAANADPGLAGLGVEIPAPTLEEGVNRRRAPAAEVDTAIGSLEELATQLPGWDLTYAVCGGTGPVRATFLNPGIGAVLAAEVRPEGATLRVTLPVTEGPAGDWLTDLTAIDPATCPASDAPAAATTFGTPAVLPTDLTPIAD